MGRPVVLELRAADYEARRFIRAQGAEARRLGYPTMAAFAKDIARGTVSLMPTPDDERLEFIGRFFFNLPRPLQQVLFVAYDDTGDNSERKAYELGRRLVRKVSRRDYFEYRKHALILLSGYLIAAGT
jgi:hypothetical protein